MSNIVTISENQVALYITPTPSNAPNEEFNIVLHDIIFNREVKYTLNGTDPITNGAIFSNPITIKPKLNKPVNLRISFYDFVTKTYEVYDGVYTISGNIVASYPCNEKVNLESVLNPLLNNIADPIESTLALLNPPCNDSFTYEFSIVFGLECDDEFRYINNDAVDSIESSLPNLLHISSDPIESIYNIIENRILDNIESTLITPQTLEVIDMGSIFPTTIADNTISCKDEYLFSNYVWTNNTGKVATMLVDGSLTVDDDLVIDGVIFEAGMYPLEGVICSPPKNQAHTYVDNYLLKDNIQPGQTVTLNIVNHYARPTGVLPGGSIKIVTSDVPFGISFTLPCDKIESLLNPVEFNNKEDIESLYIYNAFYNIISKLLMGDYFPEVFDVDNSGCKDNYLFSSVNWTNNSSGAVNILVDGYLTVDDDLVIDGVIFEEGQYGIGVCFPDDKNVAHTYPNNYLIKENVLPGQTVNIDIVNHFGVPTSGSGCLKMVSSVSNDNVLKIDNTPACTPNESILNHISINNIADPIESTLAMLNPPCNDSFPYEFDIVFGLECDDEFQYINNDAVDSIESSLTSISNANSHELESLLNSNNIDSIHSENTENIESSLQSLLHISYDPIESLVITEDYQYINNMNTVDSESILNHIIISINTTDDNDIESVLDEFAVPPNTGVPPSNVDYIITEFTEIPIVSEDDKFLEVE